MHHSECDRCVSLFSTVPMFLKLTNDPIDALLNLHTTIAKPMSRPMRGVVVVLRMRWISMLVGIMRSLVLAGLAVARILRSISLLLAAELGVRCQSGTVRSPWG